MADPAEIARGLISQERDHLMSMIPHIRRQHFLMFDEAYASLQRLELIETEELFVSLTPLGVAVRDILKRSSD